jgi:hypothetical protein
MVSGKLVSGLRQAKDEWLEGLMTSCFPTWIIYIYIAIAFTIFTIILTYSIIAYMRIGKRKYKIYSIITAMVILFLVMFTGFVTTQLSDGCVGGCELGEIEVKASDGTGRLNLHYHSGLNNSTIAKFDNDTLSLKLSVLNENISHYYHYSISDQNATFQVNEYNDGLRILYPAKVYPYNISFQFIINSTDPDVRNAIIIGTNNHLNFTLTVSGDRNLNLTFSDEYASYYDMVEYGYHNSSAELRLYEHGYIPEAKYSVGAHPFEILTRSICT